MRELYNIIVFAGLGVLIGFALYFVFLAPHTPAALEAIPPPNAVQNETLPPVLEKGSVNITMIEAPGCDECNMEGAFIEQVKVVLLSSDYLEAGISRSVPYSSAEGAALAAKYNLTELPAVVIAGPVEDDPDFVAAWQESIGTLEEGVLVSRVRYPPFYDIASGTVAGLVQSKAIMATGCMQCSDPSLFLAALEGPSVGMVFTQSEYYNWNDSAAQELISRYNITRLPAIMVSAEGASAYPVFSQMSNYGTLEDDGWFVLRDVQPPYVDLTANRTIRGLVRAEYLLDPSCTDCFDIYSLSKYIVDSSGLFIEAESTYGLNSTEGAAFAEKYGITGVPAIVYSSEASRYPDFDMIWLAQNNTIEADGAHVFRAYGLLGNVTYRNISG